MRRVICLMLVLGGVVWYCAKIDVGVQNVASQGVANSPWRRTKDGWQRADRWPDAVISPEPMELPGVFAVGPASLPHPLVDALLLLLPSLLCLLAFSKEPRAK